MKRIILSAIIYLIIFLVFIFGALFFPFRDTPWVNLWMILPVIYFLFRRWKLNQIIIMKLLLSIPAIYLIYLILDSQIQAGYLWNSAPFWGSACIAYPLWGIANIFLYNFSTQLKKDLILKLILGIPTTISLIYLFCLILT